MVSVHLALNDDTRGLLGAEFFAKLREGAYFINTSRGEVIDEASLADAVRDKGVRVGLDVFANEPGGGSGEFHPAIVDLPGVYGTHHIGASTDQAQRAIADEAVRIVTVFAETGRVPNVVNLAEATPATSTLVIRHLDRPGVLAAALDAISDAGLNVQEMENVVFSGGEAAVARINLEGTVSPETMAAIGAHESVLDVQLIAL
jgi:D-3-phosphoglycerate dehydrogenase